jgi:hypothetical protein
MTDHDRLFKELLSTFFMAFLELFNPNLAETIDPSSIRFLQQEYFSDLTSGEEKILVGGGKAGWGRDGVLRASGAQSIEKSIPEPSNS